MLSVAGLEITFHRLGAAGWTPGAVLRSWADAPWRLLQDNSIAVACLHGEMIWLGLTNTAAAATVTLTAADGRATRSLCVPPDWQLGWLLNGEGDGERDGEEQAKPIALHHGATSAAYRLALERAQPPASDTRALVLLSPAAWAAQFGPLQLAPAEMPPPVERYSRIVRRPATGKK